MTNGIGSEFDGNRSRDTNEKVSRSVRFKKWMDTIKGMEADGGNLLLDPRKLLKIWAGSPLAFTEANPPPTL